MSTPPFRPKVTRGDTRSVGGEYFIGSESFYDSETETTDSAMRTPTSHPTLRRAQTPGDDFLNRTFSEHSIGSTSYDDGSLSSPQPSRSLVPLRDSVVQPATEPKKKRGFFTSIFSKFTGDSMSESSFDASSPHAIATKPRTGGMHNVNTSHNTSFASRGNIAASEEKRTSQRNAAFSRTSRPTTNTYRDDSASEVSLSTSTTASSSFRGSSQGIGKMSNNPFLSPSSVSHPTATMSRTSSSEIISGNPFGKVVVSPGDVNSGIKSGTVANVIAKLAQEEAEYKQQQHLPPSAHGSLSNRKKEKSRSSSGFGNFSLDEEDTAFPGSVEDTSPREHYLRILGPYARDPSLWGSDEDMKRETEEYDNNVDSELLILEALLIDAQNTLNILVHEFMNYADSYVQLGSNATILSRIIHNVILALEKRAKQQRRENRHNGKLDVFRNLDAEGNEQGDEDENLGKVDFSEFEGNSESDSDSDDDMWGLCDADGVPLQLSQTQVTRAGKELSTRTKFIRTQTRLAQHIYRIFSSEFRGDLRDLALSWKDRYLSLENELLRAEYHYMQRKKASNRLNALQSTYSRAREQVKPALMAQIEDIRGIMEEHDTLYKGIMHDLRVSLTGETSMDMTVDKLLELTLSSQMGLFKSVLGNDNQSVLAKVTAATPKIRARAATKATDFFLNTRQNSQNHKLLTSPGSVSKTIPTGNVGALPGNKDLETAGFSGPILPELPVPLTSLEDKGTKPGLLGASAAAAAIKAAMAKRLGAGKPESSETEVAGKSTTLPVFPENKSGIMTKIPGNIPPAPSLESLGMALPSNIPPVPPGLLEEVLREFGGSGNSGISGIPAPPNLGGLFAKAPPKTRQVLDAEIVAKLGISGIPKADELWKPAHDRQLNIGTGTDKVGMKVWHWENIDVRRLGETIWKDVSGLLEKTRVTAEYVTLTSDPPEVCEYVEEEEEDEYGNMILVQREIKTKLPEIDIPELHFGLLTEQDVVDMALLFSQQKPMKKALVKDDSKGKIETVSLLDGKRAHALNISLGQLRMDYSELIYNIYSLSEEFPTEKVQVLLNMLPTSDEMKIIASFTGDINMLGNAEKFYYAIMTAEEHVRKIHSSSGGKLGGNVGVGNITYFEQCVRAMVFMRDFGNWIRTLSDQLDTVCNALMGLRDSPQTKLLLLAALSIGNLLNSYHANRSAGYGFKLGDLRKINGIKANMNVLDKREVRLSKEQEEQDLIYSQGGVRMSKLEGEEEEGAEDDDYDESIILHPDFTEFPMPKQANLSHFLAKLLIRRDPYLCPSLEIAAEAYAIASKIEQNTVNNDVTNVDTQMRKVNMLYTSLQENMDKYKHIYTQHGSEVAEDYTIIKHVPFPNDIQDLYQEMHYNIAFSLLSGYSKLHTFIAYATLRVTEVTDSYSIAQALISELSVLFYEPDAQEAWELLFSTWSDYLRMLSAAYEDIMKEKAKRKQIRTRKVAALEMKRKRDMQLQRNASSHDNSAGQRL